MKVPCQAVAIRYVHDAGTGESLNVGVVLLCADLKYAGVKFVESWSRITAAFPSADASYLRRLARGIETACDSWLVEQKSELPFARPNVAQLVHSVIAPSDSGFLVSPVISGITKDPAQTLRELFERQVAKNVVSGKPIAREDRDIWRKVVESFPERDIVQRLERRVVRGRHAELEIPYAWKNGAWNGAQPVSFDLLEAKAIQNKGAQWFGKIKAVRPMDDDVHVIFIVGLPPADRAMALRSAANQALALLQEELAGEAEVVLEADAHVVAHRIANDLAAHPPDAVENVRDPIDKH